MLEVLYHHAKLGGARISPAAGVTKNVEFFVCPSRFVCHAFERQSLCARFRHDAAAVTQPTTTVKATTTGKGLPSSSPGKRRHRSSDFMSTRWRRTYKQHTVSARARCGATIKQKYRTDRLYRIRFQTRMRLKYTSAVSYHRYWKQKMRQKMPQYMHRRYVTDVRYKTEKRQKMRQHSRTRYATDVEHATEKRQKVRQSKRQQYQSDPLYRASQRDRV